MKSKQIRREPMMRDSLSALRGNVHFEKFLSAINIDCGYGRTVFSADSNQSAFNQGRQSVANDIQEHLAAIERETKPNQGK
jgi:hypothetical protein